MTITEINNLHLIDVIGDVLDRLIDTSDMPFGEVLYTINPDTILSLFDRVKINPAYKMPDLQLLQDTKDTIVNELLEVETARLAQELVDIENSRIKALELRVKNLDDINVLAYNIGKHQPNMAVAMMDAISNNDVLFIEELEAEHILHKARVLKKQNIDNKKKVGRKKKLVAENCLDIIRGDNDTRTDTEIDAMKTAFANIYEMLKDGSPKRAKALINAVPYDGIIDSLKDELLEEITEGGF